MQLLKNKNQNKTSKVRFQHGQFTKKLDQQRNFKRKVRFVPTNAFDRTLAFIGLNNRLKQIMAVLFLLGIGYLMYAPNILSVNTVSVIGGSNELNQDMENQVNEWLDSSAFYYPQRNILLLSPKKIQELILADPRIYQVNKVDKKIKQKSLQIELVPRTERFLVYTPERVYDVYNDGYLKSVAGLSNEQWIGEKVGHMIKIKLPGNIESKEDFLFGADWVKDLDAIPQQLSEQKLPGLEYITFGPDQYVLNDQGNTQYITLKLPIYPDELTLVFSRMNGGSFEVILDPRASITAALKRLGLLYNQTQPDRLMKLKYIDMRLEERGFICLEDAVCAHNPEPAN